METSKMKNMVVLRNLPSNLVEEAIVILKSSKKVRKLEKIEKKSKVERIENHKKEKDYILKEAEMLVTNYISKIENKNEPKSNKTKYIRLKNYAYIASIIIIIETMMLIFK